MLSLLELVLKNILYEISIGKIYYLGMVESIVAAACARIGKTVLHVDT